jgi:hypothetical protein
MKEQNIDVNSEHLKKTKRPSQIKVSSLKSAGFDFSYTKTKNNSNQ